MKTVATTNAPAALGPYAQAQVSGGFVFTSGQIGIDPATGAIAEGIEAQAHQVFRNLTAVPRLFGFLRRCRFLFGVCPFNRAFRLGSRRGFA